MLNAFLFSSTTFNFEIQKCFHLFKRKTIRRRFEGLIIPCLCLSKFCQYISNTNCFYLNAPYPSTPSMSFKGIETTSNVIEILQQSGMLNGK